MKPIVGKAMTGEVGDKIFHFLWKFNEFSNLFGYLLNFFSLLMKC